MSSVVYHRSIRIWLFIGLVMVLVQIMVGGITRLTGSGLSITKWEIVTGTVPPLSDADWTEEFDLYQATPQYQKLNRGMGLGEFKFIYFWEYIHRLWARMMGFVFLIPFLVFVSKRCIDKPLAIRLIALIAMGALVASFGWIMVASGLVDRPWVNAYKLTLHLNLAFALFAILLNTYLYALGDLEQKVLINNGLRQKILILLTVVVAQLLVGGIMSGMKAGLYYPTWPDMNGALIPKGLFDVELWSWQDFRDYDSEPIAPMVVQFVHRGLAYLILLITVWITYRARSRVAGTRLNSAFAVLAIVVLTQVLLGIITVVHCNGQIPLLLGVLHQSMAVVLLSVVIYLRFYVRADYA